jgi:hypothetical protein
VSHIDAAELRAFDNEAHNLIERETKTMYAVHNGSAYDPTLTRKEIAAEIRKTLRKLSKSKHSQLAGADVSVRVRSYSGGGAIDVRLTVDYPVRTADEDETAWNRQNGKPWPWLTDQARAAKQIGEDLHNAYNFDGSDIQTDYFHVNYYGSVDIEEKRA